MKFLSMRDLRTQGAAIRRQLAEDQGIVLTANGQPFALVTPLDPADLEAELAAVRRARARAALDRIRSGTKAGNGMSMDEIDAVVAATRKARRSAPAAP